MHIIQKRLRILTNAYDAVPKSNEEHHQCHKPQFIYLRYTGTSYGHCEQAQRHQEIRVPVEYFIKETASYGSDPQTNTFPHQGARHFLIVHTKALGQVRQRGAGYLGAQALGRVATTIITYL